MVRDAVLHGRMGNEIHATQHGGRSHQECIHAIARAETHEGHASFAYLQRIAVSAADRPGIPAACLAAATRRLLAALAPGSVYAAASALAFAHILCSGQLHVASCQHTQLPRRCREAGLADWVCVTARRMGTHPEGRTGRAGRQSGEVEGFYKHALSRAAASAAHRLWKQHG